MNNSVWRAVIPKHTHIRVAITQIIIPQCPVNWSENLEEGKTVTAFSILGKVPWAKPWRMDGRDWLRHAKEAFPTRDEH